ncbi:MAG: hypothetical protein V4580_17555 [Bacteroidota bacterium]
MKTKVHTLILVVSLLTMCSCEDEIVITRSRHEPHPDSTCTAINHCLVSFGFSYLSVKSVKFRSYKKGTNFKEFIKEYTSDMQQDFLTNAKPDSYENKRKERHINIPNEINASVDFILITGDSLEYKISDIESDWMQFYGNQYLGWACDMKSYKLDGVKKHSNIEIKKPGFVFPG